MFVTIFQLILLRQFVLLLLRLDMYNVGVSELEELWGEDDEEGDDENNDGGKVIKREEDEIQGET